MGEQAQQGAGAVGKQQDGTDDFNALVDNLLGGSVADHEEAGREKKAAGALATIAGNKKRTATDFDP